MRNKVKDISIKNILSIKNFDANNIKIDEKSYKNSYIRKKSRTLR